MGWFIFIMYLVIVLVLQISLYCWACYTWKKSKKEYHVLDDFKQWYENKYSTIFSFISVGWIVSIPICLVAMIIEGIKKLIHKCYGI